MHYIAACSFVTAMKLVIEQLRAALLWSSPSPVPRRSCSTGRQQQLHGQLQQLCAVQHAPGLLPDHTSLWLEAQVLLALLGDTPWQELLALQAHVEIAASGSCAAHLLALACWNQAMAELKAVLHASKGPASSPVATLAALPRQALDTLLQQWPRLLGLLDASRHRLLCVGRYGLPSEPQQRAAALECAAFMGCRFETTDVQLLAPHAAWEQQASGRLTVAQFGKAAER